MSGRTSIGAVAGAALAAALLAAGCGAQEDARGRPAVVDRQSGTPYPGPPYVDMPQEGLNDGPDELGGTAARALECDGDPYYAGNDVGEGWGSPHGGGSPGDALDTFTDAEGTVLPSGGYRTEREEPGRTLFSFDDAAGRTKAAVIVAEDRPQRPGWGMETFAVCDPAEFPPDHDEDLRLQIWTDKSGARVPVTRIHSAPGHDHCGTDDIVFLSVGKDPEAPQYARDTENELPDDTVKGRYDADAALPPDAGDTGYRRDGGELWLAADGAYAYVKFKDRVEQWPGTRFPVACR